MKKVLFTLIALLIFNSHSFAQAPNKDASWVKPYEKNLQKLILHNWERPPYQDAYFAQTNFNVYSNGKIADIKILHSEGNVALDKKVVEAINKASLLTPLPVDSNCEFINVNLTFKQVVDPATAIVKIVENEEYKKTLENLQSKGSEKKYTTYLSSVEKSINGTLYVERYTKARMLNVEFEVLKNGKISNVVLLKSTEDKKLDELIIFQLEQSVVPEIPHKFNLEKIKLECEIKSPAFRII